MTKNTRKIEKSHLLKKLENTLARVQKLLYILIKASNPWKSKITKNTREFEKIEKKIETKIEKSVSAIPWRVDTVWKHAIFEIIA